MTQRLLHLQCLINSPVKSPTMMLEAANKYLQNNLVNQCYYILTFSPIGLGKCLRVMLTILYVNKASVFIYSLDLLPSKFMYIDPTQMIIPLVHNLISKMLVEFALFLDIL